MPIPKVIEAKGLPRRQTPTELPGRGADSFLEDTLQPVELSSSHAPRARVLASVRHLPFWGGLSDKAVLESLLLL